MSSDKGSQCGRKLYLFYLNPEDRMTTSGKELWRDRIKFRIKNNFLTENFRDGMNCLGAQTYLVLYYEDFEPQVGR